MVGKFIFEKLGYNVVNLKVVLLKIMPEGYKTVSYETK